MQSAWKVGLLVVLFVGMLVATYAVLERSVFAKKTDDYYVEFPNAGGLQSGARVLLAGVQIGAVTKVELKTPGLARITISVEEGYQIPKGSRAVLPTSFLSIGDRQVEIIPPAQSEMAMLNPGDTIPGSLSSPLESLLPDSKETVAELNATLVSLRELIEDEDLRSGLKSLMATTEDTIAGFGGLANRMDGMLARNGASIEQLMATTAVSLENLQVVTLEVRRLVESGDIQDRTIALLDNLNTAVQSGQKLVEELNAMATDPEMRNSLQTTLSNVEKITDSGTRIAASTEVMAENGVVVTDEAVKLSRKANELAIQVEDLIKTFKETLNRFSGATGAVFGGGVELAADVVRETNPGRIRTDLNITLPVGEEKLVFGLYDAFESNKLNLQFKRAMNSDLALRYGVYASKPGVGVDYALAPRLNLRSDLFGLNEPQLDLRLGYQLDSRFNAWLGVERIFQRPMAAVGFGIKR